MCFAFSQFMFFGELVVARLDSHVLGFGPMWASKREIFVVSCCVIFNVFMISKTSEANLYLEFFPSFRITPKLRFSVRIRRCTTPLDV